MDNGQSDYSSEIPTTSYYIFPYLRTSAPVTIRGITFYPFGSIKNHQDKFSPIAYGHVHDLSRLFYSNDGTPLSDMTFTVYEEKFFGVPFKYFRNCLVDAYRIIAYLYTSPRMDNGKPYLPFEYSTSIGFYGRLQSQDFFGGVINYHVWKPLLTKSRIYPPYPYMNLDLPQDLYLDTLLSINSRESWPLRTLIGKSEPLYDNNIDRILTAMDWYSKSCGEMVGESESILFLAMAFESLFNLPNAPEITARLKESIEILLGHDERLESWIEQFYTARSKIVHTGSWKYSGYIRTNLEGYKGVIRGKQDIPFNLIDTPLIYHGRILFRIIANVIMAGVFTAEQNDIKGLFLSNYERLLEILLILTSPGEILADAPELTEKARKYSVDPRISKKYDPQQFPSDERGIRIGFIEPILAEIELHTKDWGGGQHFEGGWNETTILDHLLIVLSKIALADQATTSSLAEDLINMLNELANIDLSIEGSTVSFFQFRRYYHLLIRYEGLVQQPAVIAIWILIKYFRASTKTDQFWELE